MPPFTTLKSAREFRNRYRAGISSSLSAPGTSAAAAAPPAFIGRSTRPSAAAGVRLSHRNGRSLRAVEIRLVRLVELLAGLVPVEVSALDQNRALV